MSGLRPCDWLQRKKGLAPHFDIRGVPNKYQVIRDMVNHPEGHITEKIQDNYSYAIGPNKKKPQQKKPLKKQLSENYKHERTINAIHYPLGLK